MISDAYLATHARSTSPLIGASLYPIIVNTQGGPRRDEYGRILRPDGMPIPGLYGAGELDDFGIAFTLAQAISPSAWFQDELPQRARSTASRITPLGHVMSCIRITY